VRFVGIVHESHEPETPVVAGAIEQPRPALTLPDRPSIAVLPFTNMSGDPEQDYFADGMVEEIITALSRLRWLFVIAHNSSFTYKGRAVDVRQVGRDRRRDPRDLRQCPPRGVGLGLFRRPANRRRPMRFCACVCRFRHPAATYQSHPVVRHLTNQFYTCILLWRKE